VTVSAIDLERHQRMLEEARKKREWIVGRLEALRSWPWRHRPSLLGSDYCSCLTESSSRRFVLLSFNFESVRI
jgi:hypothetical protein